MSWAAPLAFRLPRVSPVIRSDRPGSFGVKRIVSPSGWAPVMRKLRARDEYYGHRDRLRFEVSTKRSLPSRKRFEMSR